MERRSVLTLNRLHPVGRDYEDTGFYYIVYGFCGATLQPRAFALLIVETPPDSAAEGEDST